MDDYFGGTTYQGSMNTLSSDGDEPPEYRFGHLNGDGKLDWRLFVIL